MQLCVNHFYIQLRNKKIKFESLKQNENAKSQCEKIKQILAKLQEFLNQVHEDIKIMLIQMKEIFERLLSPTLYTVIIQDKKLMILYQDYIRNQIKETLSEFYTKYDLKIDKQFQRF
ncbi:unnamed protein product [Paramecium sonneborni]|uniref:Uncharacterized protein n=1 Tax=Paramecium sonneborni TaxID=65129 RepID=A0A8S1PHX9_9CILI|nr:unnamed protein product [Paramecium sonneborni]